MPIVQVSLIEGRDEERKARLIACVTDTVAAVLDVPAPSVRVLLHEVPPAHWGVGGRSKATTDAPVGQAQEVDRG